MTRRTGKRAILAGQFFLGFLSLVLVAGMVSCAPAAAPTPTPTKAAPPPAAVAPTPPPPTLPPPTPAPPKPTPTPKTTSLKYAVWPFFSSYVQWYALAAGKVKPEYIDLKLEPGFQVEQLFQGKAVGGADWDSIAYIIGKTKGEKYMALATHAKQTGKGNGLFTYAASPIKDPKDLVGKNVGIDSLASGSYIMVAAVLKDKYGVDPGKVTWVLKSPPEIFALLGEGKLDAGFLFGDATYAALDSPKYRLLFHGGPAFKEVAGGYPGVTFLVLHEDVLKEDPGIASRLLKAYRESSAYGKKNLEEVIAEFVKKNPDAKPDYLRRIAPDISYDFTLTDEEKKAIAKTMDYMLEFKLIDKKVNVDDIFHPAVKELR